MKKSKECPAWFREARFGAMFTWGILSMYPLGKFYWHLPYKEYKHLARDFKPKKGWAKEWVELMQQAGARYAVLTSKNDDGYCLFDTKTHDFCAPRTGPGRDLIAEYVDACRRAGIKVGIYYNTGDWRLAMSPTGPDPKSSGYSEYKETQHAQIEELCKNYGPLDLWWWDNHGLADAKNILAKMRRWQPAMIMNDRAHKDVKGDFSTPEKRNARPADPDRMWEVCMTSNHHWQYMGPEENQYMSLREAMMWLVGVACGKGNFLLDIGPKPDGGIPAGARGLFEGIGAWMDRNGESLHGSDDNVVLGSHCEGATAKGNATYLHIFFYDRIHREVMLFAPCCKVISAGILATGQKLAVKQDGIRVVISGLPEEAPDGNNTVIKLITDVSVETQKKRLGGQPIWDRVKQENIAQPSAFWVKKESR